MGRKKSRVHSVEFTAWDLVRPNSTKLEEWPAKNGCGFGEFTYTYMVN